MTTPTNTQHLMELKNFVQKAENESVLDLEKQLMQARYRLEFLLDHCTLSPAEIRSNSQTFSWYDRLPQIFEEHKTIISEKTLQFQDALKVIKFYFSMYTMYMVAYEKI